MILSNDKLNGLLHISGKLDIDNANRLREALVDCLLHQSEAVVDLSEVDECDAAALQVLLAARKDAAAAGKALCVTGASGAVTGAAVALGLSIDAAGDEAL